MLVASIFLLICACASSLGQSAFFSPPYIVKQPPATEILFIVEDPPQPISLECEAAGEPRPRYAWFKNGKRFMWQAHDERISQLPLRGTLLFSRPEDEDIGQYQCLATNEYGTATSNSVFLIKIETRPPKTRRTGYIEVNEGETLKLECGGEEGYPRPAVQWLRVSSHSGLKTINDARITSDPDGTLWFSNVTKEDASLDFSYTCVSLTLFSHTLHMGNRYWLGVAARNDEETIKSAPVRQYVSAEETAATLKGTKKLYCIFGGSPLPVATWSKNGNRLKFSDRIYVDDSTKSLVLKDVDFEDQGDYTCDVSNGVGTDPSHTMSLKVEAAPFFTSMPLHVNTAEEATVQIACPADGVPKPEIRWTYNGKDISESPNSRRSIKVDRMVIEEVKRSDMGNYGCNASNSLGYAYRDVYLNVLNLPPQVDEGLSEILTVDGLDITVTCMVFALPKPTITWKYVNRSDRFTINAHGDVFIKSVEVGDSGTYTCTAENKFGKASSSTRLLVKAHTKITEPPKNRTLEAGEVATFQCGAASDDTLVVEMAWLRFGRVINFNVDGRFVKSANNSLTIEKVSESDAGTYTCRANTSLDAVSASAELIVIGAPISPLLKTIECWSKNVTIKWKNRDDNNTPILRYVIEYSTDFEPGIWTDAANISADENEHTLSLSPWTTYIFRVIAANKIGNSAPSRSSDVCKTQPDVPYKNPDNVEGHGDQPGTMTITWTPMPEIEHNAPRFHYRVYWKRDSPHSEYQTHEFDWKTNRFVVENLEPGKRFIIRVIALNELGEANVRAVDVIGLSGTASL